MKKPLRILFVEDSEADKELIIGELTRAGYDIMYERVETAEDMTAALERRTWDLVLSDFSMPRFTAPIALSVLQTLGHDLPFIIVSGTVDEETAVTALKAGAHDFLSKGRLARLAPAIEREVQDAEARRRHRLLEAQLRQAHKMEAVGQLAAGIAHDFNNMLTTILGYTDLMVREVGLTEQMGQDLREVHRAALRAAALTRQLLAFSRTQVLAITPVDLTDIVRNVEPMLTRLLGERISIETNLATGLHLVMGDATQLEHLLVNLSVNARDAMPEGGRLRITTGNIHLDAEYVATHAGARAGTYAMLRISDTGVGMTPEVLARVFEPFFTTKDRGRGTGLGLAAVYGTVKQLEGYIDVESQPSVGTTFTIFLPKTDRVREPAADEIVTESRGGSETILLVEDEEGVRAFVKRTLERFGYRVVEAHTAEAAIELMTQDPQAIHLLITDVVLPGLTGPALADRLRQQQPALRVLFMSGYADHRLWQEIQQMETSVWLEKPFSTQALLTKVRHVARADHDKG